MSTAGRIPVILLDTIGYRFYADDHGRPYLPPDRYDVRLVTDLHRVGEATGAELSAVIGVDRHDLTALTGAARYLATFGGVPARRLVAVTERMLLPAARLREDLGLPGSTVDEMLLFRDKVQMKNHLRSYGIQVPGFAPFDRAAAHDLLKKHAAVVAKPRRGTGAVDIFVLRTEADVEAFAIAQAARLDEFEVEQFIDGELFHVDSVVHEGTVVSSVASRYLDDTTSYLRLAPSRSMSVPAGELLDRLLDFNRRVVACWPRYSGVTHHEMFVSGDEIWFCEIAARAGGGGVIAGFRSRTGIDLDEAAVRAQLDEPLPLPSPPEPHLSGFAVLYAPPTRINRPLRAPRAPWVLEAQMLADPGDTITKPANCNDAVAIISVRGDTPHQVVDRMASVAHDIRIELEDAGDLQ